MVNIPWHKYSAIPRHQREKFAGIILQKDNSANCYEIGEEKKYQRALRKKEKESLEGKPLLLI